MSYICDRFQSGESSASQIITGAEGVIAARPASQQARGGANPTSALQSILVAPVPVRIAKQIIVQNHYLHSMPGGTHLSFGVFLLGRLLGALTLGVGPVNAHRLVHGSNPRDCATLTRLWLSDELPRNSESRVIAVVLRSLKKNTDLKFVLSYADPAQGHLGVIYQATGWLYIGRSAATPLYDLGDGKGRHSRTLGHSLGTHSLRYFEDHGVEVKLVPQAAKHRYINFLVPDWRHRLKPEVLAYPQQIKESEPCK